MNSRSAGTRGRTHGLCQQDIREIPTQRLKGATALIAAQTQVMTAIAGQAQALAGGSTPARDYLQAIRALVALCLRAAEAEDLTDIPLSVREQFARFASQRALQSGQKRVHYFRETPKDPALVAAVLPVCTAMLAAGSAAELADRLVWLVQRMRSTGGPKSAPRIVRGAPALLGPWRDAAMLAGGLAQPRRTVEFSRRVRIHAWRGSAGAWSFSPSHVPQLLWKDAYDELFSDLRPPRYSEGTMRRFCALALVRLSRTGISWQTAVAILGLPARSTKTMLIVASELKKNRREEQFHSALGTIARRLDGQHIKVNYGERREALRQLHTIDWVTWLAICRRADIYAGKQHGKARFAAAWLWAEITCGDPVLAPALESAKAWERIDYWRFVDRDLPVLRNSLLGYGKTLLGVDATVADPTVG